MAGKRFSNTTENAMQSAIATARRVASSTAPSKGRATTSTPAKPSAVAVQRRQRTISPRNRTAATVTNRGTVKLIAVTSASGSFMKA